MNGGQRKRILIVDDEKGLVQLLSTALKKEEDWTIDTAYSGQEAIDQVKRQAYDLILLDVMLPDIDGFAVCRTIRERTIAPILFLTARTSEIDKLTGLGIGGDDYITKPFNPLEVVARVKAQLRQCQRYQEATQYALEPDVQLGSLTINRSSAQLWVNGKEITCPAKEFELLLFFIDHPNQVFTAQQLYELIWGSDSLGDDKTVAVHIGRIRKKIEKDPKHPNYMVNLRGIGYKFVPPRKEGER